MRAKIETSAERAINAQLLKEKLRAEKPAQTKPVKDKRDSTKAAMTKSGKTPSLRVTGGMWRSRVLQAPGDGMVTRPTMDQTRLAVFNILNSAAWALQQNGQPLLINATVLDGFAGSGAYAFDALSRGAAFATVVDKDRDAVTVCQANATSLKCTTQVKTLRSDVLTLSPNSDAPVTLCFLDPPYGETEWSDILMALSKREWIDADTLLVLEADAKQGREFNAAIDGVLTIHDQRRYGHALVTFGKIRF